jgi:hypothetical protein
MRQLESVALIKANVRGRVSVGRHHSFGIGWFSIGRRCCSCFELSNVTLGHIVGIETNLACEFADVAANVNERHAKYLVALDGVEALIGHSRGGRHLLERQTSSDAGLPQLLPNVHA